MTGGGGGGALGNWAAGSANTTYTAASDGFIIGSMVKYINDNTGGYASVQTPVGTVRQYVGTYEYEWADTMTYVGFTVPVKAGDTWAVVTTGSAYTLQYLWFIPLGG